jgi:hypothetical protein
MQGIAAFLRKTDDQRGPGLVTNRYLRPSASVRTTSWTVHMSPSTRPVRRLARSGTRSRMCSALCPSIRCRIASGRPLIAYTPARTSIDADGRIRLVLSTQDPGYWNWIDTQGFVAGMLTLRNIHAAHLPTVSTRLVPVSEVPAAMHASSRRILQAERVGELKRRFDAIRRRYRL